MTTLPYPCPRPLALFLYFLTTCVCAPSLFAQIDRGTIDYRESRQFELWDGASDDMKKRIQEAQARGDFDRMGRLSFTAEEMSYQQLPKEISPNASGGMRNWYMRDNENPDVYHLSFADSIVTDRRRIMDKSFIMSDAWVVPEWEIPENQQLNSAYLLPSKAAFAVSPEGDTLTAYFTPTIPLGIGPRGYGGLPGAIVYLKVEKDNSYTEYVMTTMQPNAPDLEVAKPVDGEVVDRDKFEKMKAKREEMMARRRRSWERGE